MKHDLPNFFHSLLAQDGRIIVYGGIKEDETSASNPLLVLDITVQSFEWSMPKPDNNPNFAPTMRDTATLVGNYMIVAFGILLY